jgi:hypothetical protein
MKTYPIDVKTSEQKEFVRFMTEYQFNGHIVDLTTDRTSHCLGLVAMNTASVSLTNHRTDSSLGDGSNDQKARLERCSREQNNRQYLRGKSRLI